MLSTATPKALHKITVRAYSSQVAFGRTGTYCCCCFHICSGLCQVCLVTRMALPQLINYCHLTFRGPCIVINCYNKPTGCTDWSIYFLNRILRVSDRFSVHHQESNYIHSSRYMSYMLCWLLASKQSAVILRMHRSWQWVRLPARAGRLKSVH